MSGTGIAGAAGDTEIDAKPTPSEERPSFEYRLVPVVTCAGVVHVADRSVALIMQIDGWARKFTAMEGDHR